MLDIGTMFALAVMTFTVMLALEAILAMTASFWAGKVLLGSNLEGVTSVVMQQDGLGLFMTALIVSAPSMMAAFLILNFVSGESNPHLLCGARPSAG